MKTNVPIFPIQQENAEIHDKVLDSWDHHLRDGAFIGGSAVKNFEAKFGCYTDGLVVSCASGTDALVLALKALGADENTTVAVPALTFTATAEAVKRVDAELVFWDVNYSGLIDPHTNVQYALDPDIIIAVALWGMRPAIPLLRQKFPKAKIIIDAAQAFHPLRPFKGSDLVTYSFYPTKPLGGAGDGGAVVCYDEFTRERLEVLANHGRWKDNNTHLIRGYNSRLDALQASYLLAKMDDYRMRDKFSKRDLIHARYLEGAKRNDYKNYRILSIASDNHGVLPVKFHNEFSRYFAIEQCNRRNVGYSIQYPRPLHLQPAYSDMLHLPSDFPIATELAQTVLCLPCHPYMTEDDATSIIDILDSV